MIDESVKKISEGGCSSSEIKLLGVCIFLIGVIVGMIICPVKFGVFGSFNGNQGSLTAPEKLSLGGKKDNDDEDDEDDD